MRALCHLISLLLIASLGACAATPPRWRPEALISLDRAKSSKSEEIFPTEYRNARDTFLQAEELLREGHHNEAEKLYLLAQQEALVVRQRAEAERARRAAEEKRRAEEEARLAEERRKAAELERQQAERVAREKAAEAAAAKAAAEAARKRAKPAPVKEQHLVSSYTVKRGQSLPLIAAQPEVYNDRALWPLLYRANRDQISDPRHLWPGQVLRVPRNVGRDDVQEAHRYAQERPLH